MKIFAQLPYFREIDKYNILQITYEIYLDRFDKMRILEFFKATIRTMEKHEKTPEIDLFLCALMDKCNFVVLPNAIDLQYLIENLIEMVYKH